jgi:hypothetical protein
VDPFAALFAEELGLVLEVAEGHAQEVQQRFEAAGVACSRVGQVRLCAGLHCLPWCCVSLRCCAGCCCTCILSSSPGGVGWLSSAGR